MSKAREALKKECKEGFYKYPPDHENEIFDLIDKIESTRDLQDWKQWMLEQYGGHIEDDDDDEVSYCVSASGRRMSREVASNYF